MEWGKRGRNGRGSEEEINACMKIYFYTEYTEVQREEGKI